MDTVLEHKRQTGFEIVEFVLLGQRVRGWIVEEDEIEGTYTAEFIERRYGQNMYVRVRASYQIFTYA